MRPDGPFKVHKTCCDYALGHSPECQFTILEKENKDLRSRLAESVAKECKCETNTAVNHDLLNRALKMKEFLIDCSASHHETRYKYRAKALLKQLYPNLKTQENNDI